VPSIFLSDTSTHRLIEPETSKWRTTTVPPKIHPQYPQCLSNFNKYGSSQARSQPGRIWPYTCLSVFRLRADFSLIISQIIAVVTFLRLNKTKVSLPLRDLLTKIPVTLVCLPDQQASSPLLLISLNTEESAPWTAVLTLLTKIIWTPAIFFVFPLMFSEHILSIVLHD